VSAATPVTRPAPRPAGAPSRAPRPQQAPRAPLSVVRTRPQPSRAPFVVLVVGLLLSGLVALLLLNTALTQGAFQEKNLSREVKQLTGTQQSLRLHLAAVQEPRALAERATQLGLVPSQCPVFLRLPAADVLGTPCAAAAAKRAPAATAKSSTTKPAASGAGKPANTTAGTVSKSTATKSTATKSTATKSTATKTTATKTTATKTTATKTTATKSTAHATAVAGTPAKGGGR
jgi:hypothetical protein